MPTIRKFDKKLRGYDCFQVNKFVDQVIKQMEDMVVELNKSDEAIKNLQERVAEYRTIEANLNKAVMTVQDSGNLIKRMAEQESQMIVSEAKKNANRIVNEALMRAQKTEYEAANLRKNIAVFKNRIRSIIESQLEIVEDLDNENI